MFKEKVSVYIREICPCNDLFTQLENIKSFITLKALVMAGVKSFKTSKIAKLPKWAKKGLVVWLVLIGFGLFWMLLVGLGWFWMVGVEKFG